MYTNGHAEHMLIARYIMYSHSWRDKLNTYNVKKKATAVCIAPQIYL